MIFYYRLLGSLYPRRFRQRYREEMLRALLDRRDEARRKGWWRLACFDAAATRDLLTSAAAENAGSLRPAWISLAQDVRFALRMLRRRPTLSLFSAATLGLGIGAVTAVTSLVDAVLVQPLPYPRPAEIVAIRGEVNGRPAGISYENLRDLKAHAASISMASPFYAQSVNLTGVPQPDRLRGGFVTSAFFDVVGVRPVAGDVFSRKADIPGAERVAVLTDAAWKVRFGGAPDIIGRTLLLNNAPFTVIGVMPASFRFPIDAVDVYLPFWATTAGIGRGNHNYIAIGRILPTATIAAASAEAAAAAQVLERVHPGINAGRSARVEPFKDALIEDMAYPIQLLATMVAIMLMAACANVAGLHLGETAGRRREISVRAALGAGRLRIGRQLIVESLVRATLGAVLGVVAARVVVTSFVANAPAGVYGLENARLSLATIGIAGCVAILAGIASGLPAAVQWASAGGLAAAGGGRAAGDAPTSRLRSVLVVCQIAIAAVLLVALGLTARSFDRLASVDVGFDPTQLLTMEYRLPPNKYGSPAAQAAFHRQVLDRVRALPDVEGAAAVRGLPFSGNGGSSSFRIAKDGEPRQAAFNAVSGGFFETMRIPLVAGRTFRDDEGSDLVVIVSRSLAERTWPGENALGRRLYFDGVNLVASVIGVVGDVRHRDLAEEDRAAIYTSQAQNPGVFNTLAVRTIGSPMARADDVRSAVWSVDPDQPVWKIRTLESLIDRSLATRRFLLQLVVFFGVSTAALAILGLYGVVASMVAQRTREIGVRVALGATRGSVLSLVLWTGVRLGALGVAIGLAGALVVANLLRSFLFAISSRDPLTFAGAAVLLLGAALLACWIPAVRALRVDPVDALRT